MLDVWTVDKVECSWEDWEIVCVVEMKRLDVWYLNVTLLGSEFQCIEDFDRLIVRDGIEKVCSLCGVFRNKTITNVRCHIEAKHYPGLFSYTCEGCRKLCRTKNAFMQHKKICRHLDCWCWYVWEIFTDSKSDSCFILERYAQLQDFIKQNTGPGHSCLICGKGCNKLHAVQYHIESAHGKHFNVTYQCELCDKVTDTKNAYITHKSRNHKKVGGSLFNPFITMS